MPCLLRSIYVRSVYWRPFIVSIALLCLIGNPKAAIAQNDVLDNQPSIQVTGNGQVDVQPDEAVVRIGVETEAETASDAIAQNNQQMQSLMDAFVEAGVAQEQIQTQVIQLQPIYKSEAQAQSSQPPSIQPQGSGGDEIVGYRATNIVEVRTQELDQLGELLDTAIQAGGNRIEGIQFSVSDPASQLDQARETAWNEAQRKAEQLAALAGAELGRALTIIESGTNVPMAADRTGALSVSTVPIAPGTQTIQATLQVTWELVHPDEN